ncbi:MAG: flagellar protein FlgN [Syntrophomonadaceae bacterium]|nr:flagellar protein FlgN [Syntrophomonadaceae bacterium]
MMQDLLKEFIEATAKVNQTLTELADIGIEKQQLIIANEVKELDSLMRKEGIVVSNLNRLEGARFQLQEKLARAWGMSAQDLSATVLLDKVKAEFNELSEVLEKEINNLNYNLSSLQAINTHNNELIEQSLEYIESIQSLVEGDVAGTYSAQGERSDEAPARPSVNLLDKKV